LLQVMARATASDTSEHARYADVHQSEVECYNFGILRAMAPSGRYGRLFRRIPRTAPRFGKMLSKFMTGLLLPFDGVLEQPKNDEFCRFQSRNADLANQPPVKDVILSHGGSVAPDKVCLVVSTTQQRPGPPLAAQKLPDCASHSSP